jgi:two-component system sensor histidine kinase BaeS
MLRTLRGRFILSHALPLLVIIPVMGIALVYILETQVMLPRLSDELTGDALLIAGIAGDDPSFWANPAQAQELLAEFKPHLAARVMFLDGQGRLLASSDAADEARLGQRIDRSGLAEALHGDLATRADYSQSLQSEVADVWAPVVGANQEVIGVVRLTYQFSGVYEQFMRLRSLIAGVLLAGLLLGTLVGWVLALNLEQSLKQVTQAVYRLASGQQLGSLPEHGPRETRLLLHAVNTLAERRHTLEESRRKLLANLTHELGRPLGSLAAAIQALRSGASDDPVLRCELLEGMAAETQQLQRLLDDLAGLHDQVVGTLELQTRPVAMSDWLPALLAPWHEAARDDGVDWEEDIPSDLPVLEVDPERLGQSLGNLLSNAIKFTPPGGKVSVDAGTQDQQVWVRVSDTGPGIDEAEQERIFTPLYRGNANGRFPRGMGLGLSIARDLVVAHGGRLEVESTPGQGSQFTCWIPCGPQYVDSEQELRD